MYTSDSERFALPMTGIKHWVPWIAVGILQLLFGIVATMYGWYWDTIVLLSLVTTVIVVTPRAGLYLLMLSIFFEIDLPIRRGIYVADLLVFMTIFATVLNRLVKGKPLVVCRRTVSMFLVVLGAFALSLYGAHNLGLGVINWLRHAQLVGLFITAVAILETEDIFRLIKWFLFLTAVAAIASNFIFFIKGGHARVFGITGQSLERFLIVACIHSALGFLTTRRFRAVLGWGILLLIYGMALTFTQTRAAMMQVTLGMIFLTSVLWFSKTALRLAYVRRRIMALVICGGIFGTLLVTDALPILDMPSGRIAEVLEGRAGTVNLRLFLWRIGFHAFADRPLLGIGLGQVSTWDEVLPYWRFGPEAARTRGLGAHNDFVTYLAETGVVGTLPLLFFFWSMFQRGVPLLRRSTSFDRSRRIVFLWAPVVTLCIGFFFSYHLFYSLTGMMTMMYFAMWTKFSEAPKIETVGLSA